MEPNKFMGGEPTDKKSEIKFENDCPIEEVADLTYQVHLENNGPTENGVKDSEKRIQGFLDRPNATEVILRIDGELVGCAFSFEESKDNLKKEVPYADFFTNPEERVFHAKGLNIKREYRGQGFGQMLTEQIMAEARQKGATKIILTTPWKDPLPARKLYEKLGFKEVAPNQLPDSFYMQYEYTKEEK